MLTVIYNDGRLASTVFHVLFVLQQSQILSLEVIVCNVFVESR